MKLTLRDSLERTLVVLDMTLMFMFTPVLAHISVVRKELLSSHLRASLESHA